MRRAGPPQVVFSVEVWAAIGRLPLPQFKLIQAAIEDAQKSAALERGVEPVRHELRAGNHLVDCVYEPLHRLFTIESIRRASEDVPR